MAAQRPVVLLYEEYATPSTTPATPELNCLIAGAAYFIQDFPDDKTNTKSGTGYGTLNAPAPYVSPVAHTTALAITALPNADPTAVAPPPGAILDPASARVYFGSPRVQLLAGTDGTVAALSNGFASAAGNLANAGIQAGDTCILTDSAGSPKTLVRTVLAVSGLTCTLTDEIPNTGFTPGAGGSIKWRFERTLPDSEIDSSFVSTPAPNEIDIAGGVTLYVGTNLLPVTSADVYVAYRALRQDLADIGTIQNVLAVPGTLGLIDARNPLAVGLFVALENTNTPLQYFGVTSDDLIGYTAMKSSVSGRKDLYAVVPLITDIDVIQMLAVEFMNLADVNYALTNGVPQKLRVVIGSPTTLPTEKTVSEISSGIAQAYAGASDLQVSTIDVVGIDFSTVLPGDHLIVEETEAGGIPEANTTADPLPALPYYTVAHVNSLTELTIDENITPAVVVSKTSKFTVKRGNVTIIAQTAALGATSKANGSLFLDLYDAAATFLDSLVIPGDFLEIPSEPVVPEYGGPTQDYTAIDRWVVAQVLSNQRLRIKQYNADPSLSGDTSTLAKELPHGFTRSAPITAITTTTPISYRVSRALNQDGQVKELISVAQSLGKRRAIIVWPDLVDVADLVDGSLPRTAAAPSTPVAAGSQPGYYLACAVGGMTAGLPSHQGFTNLSIAAIKKLYHSNSMFSDLYITQISNSGWFLFQQDTPVALPYCVHQLTTDVSALELSEYSMVKNMDYVSTFFADIVNGFIGPWNINADTLGFMNAAVHTGIDVLKLDKKIKIGARINDAKISQLYQSAASKDRVEVYVQCNFPPPLNTVGLHIVSQ